MRVVGLVVSGCEGESGGGIVGWRWGFGGVGVGVRVGGAGLCG